MEWKEELSYLQKFGMTHFYANYTFVEHEPILFIYDFGNVFFSNCRFLLEYHKSAFCCGFICTLTSFYGFFDFFHICNCSDNVFFLFLYQ